MFGRIVIVCTVALLAAAEGCSLDSFSVSYLGSARYKQVVAGSVDLVSAKLQDGLSEANIVVLAKQRDEEMRLVCGAKSGAMPCLILKQEKAKGAEKTAVTVEWDRLPDETFWSLVVSILRTPTPPLEESPAPQDATDRDGRKGTRD